MYVGLLDMFSDYWELVRVGDAMFPIAGEDFIFLYTSMRCGGVCSVDYGDKVLKNVMGVVKMDDS